MLYLSMKKLPFLFLLVVSVGFSQPNAQVKNYFIDGNSVKEKKWVDGNQQKTLIETSYENGSGFRYYINEDDIEIGAFIEVVREYGKHFKVNISILNGSDNQINFLPENIEVLVNGNVKNKEKYKAVTFKDYKKKVKNSQTWATVLTSAAQGFSQGYSRASAYSTSTSTNWDNGYPQTSTTQTYTYSPALASIQRQQNQEVINQLSESQAADMNYINEGYLKNHTLFPNTALEGYFLIRYNKKITDIDIAIKIENLIFDFSNDRWHFE